MWQIYAMMAKDQIDEQLRQAELRRQSAAAVRAARSHRRPHLPGIVRHPARPSSRAA